MLCQDPIWGPDNVPSPRNGAFSLSVAHPFFRLRVYPVLCYNWLARRLWFDARAAHISPFVLSVPRWRPILYFYRSDLISSTSLYLIIQYEYLLRDIL
jgi:hypothetical protein